MKVVQASPVRVPVSDIDRALATYRDCLGFSVTQDFGSGPSRSVTLISRGQVMSIVLLGGSPDEPVGSLREAVLPVSDLAAILGCLRWAGLTEHWVDTDAPGGPAALFADHDGNVWTLWQPQAGEGRESAAA